MTVLPSRLAKRQSLSLLALGVLYIFIIASCQAANETSPGQRTKVNHRRTHFDSAQSDLSLNQDRKLN
ncbi:hypothetical protein RND71_027428 [Anisodus tanguticus]|uniref:Secreted protein n=1 Tax=Anisodus tanguticus TaxID=243964 RepID=A0AAE1V908_9SOLA|nr:hypothetical protein RND71_027428 [Anisodus tanguticus]